MKDQNIRLCKVFQINTNYKCIVKNKEGKALQNLETFYDDINIPLYKSVTERGFRSPVSLMAVGRSSTSLVCKLSWCFSYRDRSSDWTLLLPPWSDRLLVLSTLFDWTTGIWIVLYGLNVLSSVSFVSSGILLVNCCPLSLRLFKSLVKASFFEPSVLILAISCRLLYRLSSWITAADFATIQMLVWEVSTEWYERVSHKRAVKFVVYIMLVMLVQFSNVTCVQLGLPAHAWSNQKKKSI